MPSSAAPIDTSNHAPVLIIGAGPVGMTLALDLAQREVDTILVEKNAQYAEPLKRCNHIASATMETFRRLGLASAVRHAGLPADFPQDVIYATGLFDHELTRLRIPSRAKRYDSSGYIDSDWPTAEPAHRCNQMYFEPILRERVRSADRIRTFFDTEVTGVEELDDRVVASARRSNGEKVTFEGRYAVGCDGGASMVRKAIGANFVGDAKISKTRGMVVRAPELLAKMKLDPAWMTWILNPAGLAIVVALDGRELWLISFWVAPDAEFDAVDPTAAVRRVVGPDVPFEIEAIDDWYGRRLVADTFRKGRFFLCGDSAHIWVPFAGYGMNAGIADAVDLGWQLSAVVHGWAGPGLLDAYDCERQPVTEQVSRQVLSLAASTLAISVTGKAPPDLMREGPAGEETRRRLGEHLYEGNVGQFAPIGMNFGSFYDRSPVIAYDGADAPAYGLTSYQPSTVPGCRTPHLRLPDGEPLYDLRGPEFTLLRFDPEIDASGLVAAARDRGLPLKLVDLKDTGGGVYDRKLVLSRPDRHVAWRGDVPPDDPVALVDLIRGASAGTPPVLDEHRAAAA